tara:strand:+ start:2983 stop:3255 length:273 start_codon:yes stop_codon:yes gene_type:complete
MGGWIWNDFLCHAISFASRGLRRFTGTFTCDIDASVGGFTVVDVSFAITSTDRLGDRRADATFVDLLTGTSVLICGVGANSFGELAELIR